MFAILAVAHFPTTHLALSRAQVVNSNSTSAVQDPTAIIAKRWLLTASVSVSVSV